MKFYGILKIIRPLVDSDPKSTWERGHLRVGVKFGSSRVGNKVELGVRSETNTDSTWSRGRDGVEDLIGRFSCYYITLFIYVWSLYIFNIFKVHNIYFDTFICTYYHIICFFMISVCYRNTCILSYTIDNTILLCFYM